MKTKINTPLSIGECHESKATICEDGHGAFILRPVDPLDTRAERVAIALVGAFNAHDRIVGMLKRWSALDGGAWHIERHAAEKRELLAETRATIAEMEVN